MTAEIRDAGPDTWPAIAEVLGPAGGYSGCWCTFWRLTNQEIHAQTPADNRATLHRLVTSGEPTGLVLYLQGAPAGWCQVAPRPAFPRLFRTRGLQLADPDDESVWSIVCVYLARRARGGGHAGQLVEAAVEYARRHGASRVEAYPVIDASAAKASLLSSGTISLFSRSGFTIAGKPSGRRVVMSRTA